VLNALHVEADGGHGGDDLAEFELVENGGLAGAIETDHLRKDENKQNNMNRFRKWLRVMKRHSLKSKSVKKRRTRMRACWAPKPNESQSLAKTTPIIE
jgi:hypothetical protein